jgi:hypothetical protein
VYLEASIISYLTARSSRDVITAANQELTRVWWSGARDQFEVYISELVLLEIGAGDPEAARRRLAVAEQLPRLNVPMECSLLAQHLLEEGGLPEKAARDALHVAVAAVNKMDFLLTWNCRHIANASLMPKLSAIIDAWGYVSPQLCTPPQLLKQGLTS